MTDDIVARLNAEIGLIEAFGWEHDTRLLRDAGDAITRLQAELNECHTRQLITKETNR